MDDVVTGPTAGPACTRCGRDWLGHEHPCATAPKWADLFGIDPTFTTAQRCTCHEDTTRGGAHWADCPTDTAVRALQVVCEVAFQWAGEYGFAVPERATEVWDAAKLLRPDLEPTRLLRRLADRIDHHGAPKAVGLWFTFERGQGLVVNEDRRGCRLWHYGDDDYAKAHTESQSAATVR